MANFDKDVFENAKNSAVALLDAAEKELVEGSLDAAAWAVNDAGDYIEMMRQETYHDGISDSEYKEYRVLEARQEALRQSHYEITVMKRMEAKREAKRQRSKQTEKESTTDYDKEKAALDGEIVESVTLLGNKIKAATDRATLCDLLRETVAKFRTLSKEEFVDKEANEKADAFAELIHLLLFEMEVPF